MRKWIVGVVAAATLICGVMNLFSLMGQGLPVRAETVLNVFPLEFVHVARFVTLLSGFALVISSVNLWKRKKRAWQIVVVLTLVSAAVHLTKRFDYAGLLSSAVLLGLLFAARKSFTVRSSIPDLRWGFLTLTVAVMAALLYGVAGFWLLDPREFGINFHLQDAIRQTVLFLTLQGDPLIVPRTRYARWFLDSLSVTTGVTIAYSLFAVFRPVIYRYRIRPQERLRAEEIMKKHGRTGLDYFKLWNDKSFYFSETGESFLSYKVGGGYAMVLGDPVGIKEQFEELLFKFEEYCRQSDWRVALYQTLPDFLPVYRKLGFRKLKIGDDAIVDLAQFGLERKQYRRLRAKVSQLEKLGIQLVRHPAPIEGVVLQEARQVSDSWLQIPGRRERTFALGMFEEAYVSRTPVYAAEETNGRMLAFVNEIPAFSKGECTMDLMRHRSDAPAGIMDYLFTKVMLEKKAEGYSRFNMGMAPMSGFQEREEATLEERAVHAFMQRLNFLFNYQGLRFYKAKFATGWEPRFLIYRNMLTLPLVAKAITAVSELRD